MHFANDIFNARTYHDQARTIIEGPLGRATPPPFNFWIGTQVQEDGMMTSICQIPHINASILRRRRDFRDLAEIMEIAEDQENH